ncbi:MAG: HEAT repeat domain-containing protein [Planctomycetes bacterium]|nr:HEAT repeat domain-containing protein [Planctomycetota bacterium]
MPGRFYVSTKFLHIFFVPLIPLGSWVVINETDRGWEGKQIGVSLLSILMAWFRAAIVLVYLGIAVKMFIDMFGSRMPLEGVHAVMFAGLSLLCMVAFRLSYRLSVASTKRAQQLALKLGYSEAEAARIDVPRGTRALGRPGWGLAMALIPLVAWMGTGLVMGKFLFADAQSKPLEVLRSSGMGTGRSGIFQTLNDVGVDPAAADVYRRYLSDPNATVRCGAALALGKIGEAGRAGLPELMQGLKDQDLSVRQYCAETLIHMGGGYEAAVGDLIKMVDDPADAINTVLTRNLAAQALGNLGSAAIQAAPYLERAQTSKYAEVRDAARTALGRIRPEGR